MIQRYHTIIKPQPNGWFVGWVEEIPGTITHGSSLDNCRAKLRESLTLMVETHRDEARMCLDRSCILEPIEIEVADQPLPLLHHPAAHHVGRHVAQHA